MDIFGHFKEDNSVYAKRWSQNVFFFVNFISLETLQCLNQNLCTTGHFVSNKRSLVSNARK